VTVARPALIAVFLPLLAVLAGTAAWPTQPAPLQLEPISTKGLAHCERSGLLRPVCPELIPKVPGYHASLYVEPHLDVFNLEHGAEYPRYPERNRPPRMLHVVVVAGGVERLTSFRAPSATTGTAVRDGLMRRDRAKPLAFGRVRWGGRAGAFYLMPSWPRGGMLGNHLVFSWQEERRSYALSLHAWEPLTEGAQTLRALVESVPGVPEARRVIRLSPVRRIALPRGTATVRKRIEAPAGRYVIDVRSIARDGADLTISLEPADGDRRRVLESRSAACRTRRPYRLCHVGLPARDVRAGSWSIVVEKRSLAPASVRVDVMFRER
jgi:hypothetical protein